MDRLDRHLLRLIQEDTRQSAERLGSVVGLSAAAVQRRLKSLRDTGVIVAETAVLDAEKLGLGFTAIVHVDLIDESAVASANFCRRMNDRDEVQQCYGVTGDHDYVLVVVVPDLQGYDAFCEECLLHDANIRSFTTQVALKVAKRGLALKL